MGLRESIKAAKSESDVLTLVKSGEGFEFASTRTRRSWKSTAKFRIAELSNPITAGTPSEAVKSKKVSKKKSN